MRSDVICPSCSKVKDNYARIRVEIVEKKSREIVEVLYGEVLCFECLDERYKRRDRLRIYV